MGAMYSMCITAQRNKEGAGESLNSLVRHSELDASATKKGATAQPLQVTPSKPSPSPHRAWLSPANLFLFLPVAHGSFRTEGREGKHEWVGGPGNKIPKPAILCLLPRSLLPSLQQIEAGGQSS